MARGARHELVTALNGTDLPGTPHMALALVCLLVALFGCDSGAMAGLGVGGLDLAAALIADLALNSAPRARLVSKVLEAAVRNPIFVVFQDSVNEARRFAGDA